METIEQLKQAAKEREENAQANALAQKQSEDIEHAALVRALLNFIRDESPLSSDSRTTLVVPNSVWQGAIVTFKIEGHADIAARYAFRLQETYSDEQERWMPGPWRHEGFDNESWYDGNRYFDPDENRKWRVDAFERIDWDSEEEHYYPRYRSSYFEDLGAALLAAERAYVDPVQIDDQLAEKNALAAFDSPVAEIEHIAEPTAEEKFMSSLKDLILEFAAQTRAVE